MKRTLPHIALCAVLAAGCLVGKLALAADAPAEAKDKGKAATMAPKAAPAAAPKAPESIKLDKVGKLAPVIFPHAKHGEMFPCKDCHEGQPPLFAQRHSETGMKMADMKAGKGCGSCHDGKKLFDKDKKIFAATNCMKCHKAAPKTESKDTQAK